MKRFTTLSFSIRSMLTVLILSAMAASLFGSEFSADFIERDKGLTKPGKLFVKDSLYRIDLIIDDEQFSLIVDQEAGISRVLRKTMSQYLEVKSQDPASLMNDPFQGLKYTIANNESKLDGTDTIGGYVCERQVVVSQDKTLLTYWMSKELDFPLKIMVNVAGDKHMELKHIRVETVDDSLFQIPSGYRKMHEPGKEPVPVPDWADQIASAPVMTPPFEQELSAGKIIRIKVVPGKSIWIKGDATSDSQATARAIPFKNGKPLNNVTRYNNFAQRGVICTRRHETTEEADEIVIRVSEGNADITAKYGDMHEKRIAAGEEYRMPLATRDNIEVRVVNTGDEKVSFGWTYFKEGQPLGDDVVGPAKYRNKTLAHSGDLHITTLVPFGDELVINVETGDILVKMGQFDSFEF